MTTARKRTDRGMQKAKQRQVEIHCSTFEVAGRLIRNNSCKCTQRCITNEKTKENFHEGMTWSEMGKQNVQAKKVY